MMTRSTNSKIALAHLTSRVKQAMVAMLSVTFGISMYVFMNGFMTGVNDTQTDLAFSTLAHIHIYNDLPEDRSNLAGRFYDDAYRVHIRNPKVIRYTEGIKNSTKIVSAVKNHPDVKGIASQVNINIFFKNGAAKINGLLAGIEVANEDELFETSQYIIKGSWEELSYRNDGLIIGKGLAEKLSLGLNDNVLVTTSDGVSRNFKIIGVIETTLGSVDNGRAYVRISTARQLISKNQNYVTDLQVNVHDFNKAQKVAHDLVPSIDYKVEAWMESNGQLEAANELRDIIAIAVSLTILIVAGFGIYNIMNMTVNEKIKEIAILKAMGFEGRDIIEIFLFQSIVIGIAGGLMGMVLGYLISVMINQVPFEIATLERLPMTYAMEDYVSAFFFGLITTFIAGYLPAKKASKVDPVEIIRG